MAAGEHIRWAVDLDGKWEIYPEQICRLLEASLDQASAESPEFGMPMSQPAFRYTVDLLSMEQVNRTTRKRRKVGRDASDGKVEALAARAVFIKAQQDRAWSDTLSQWAADPNAWPFWPASRAADGGFGDRRKPQSSAALVRLCDEDVEPPWPPPPHTDTEFPLATPRSSVPYEACLRDVCAGAPPELAAILSCWRSVLPQCVAADGRRRNFSIERLAAESIEAQSVGALLGGAADGVGSSIGGRGGAVSMRRCYRLQSLSLLRAFLSRRHTMTANLADDGFDSEALLHTRLMWHGPSTRAALEGISQSGFDRLQCSGGLNAFGAGNYFARRSHLAASYAPELLDAADADRRPCKAIFLCALMHDELTLGEKGRFPPPRKPHSPSGAAFSATAGPPSARDGERDVIVTYADGQAIPLYIVCLEA